jgi:hypothetical protein
MKILNFTQLVCLLFISQFVYAQKNFEPGYLVNARQDTLKGFIEYLNWSRNPENISFKSQLENPAKTYGLSEISSFFVHNERYVKAVVSINELSDKNNELATSPFLKVRQDTVLLTVMTEGPKSLYYWKGSDSKEQFYIKKNGAFELLTYYRYQLTQDGQSGIVVIDPFKKQLAEYFADCEATKEKTSFLTYTQGSITGLFKTYYKNCQRSANDAMFKSEGITTQLGIIAGLGATKLTLKGAAAVQLFQGSFPVSTQAAGGVFINLILPRTQRKVSIYNELFFTSYKVQYHTEKYTSEQDNSYKDFTLGYSYLKLNVMGRYTVPLNRSKLFFNVGISNGYAFSEKNSLRTVTNFYSDKGRVTDTKAIVEARKYEQGLLFGIGGTSGKFSLEARYELGNGMSPFSSLKTTARRYYGLLAYRLK